MCVMTGLRVAALAALTAAACLPSDTAAFERRHPATIRGKPVKTADYLKITKLSPTEISFCLDTLANNANMCNLSGKAVRGQGEETYVYKMGKPGKECILELTPTKEAWVVTDKTGACTRQSCGAGANIGKLTFLLKDQAKKIRPCEGE